MHCGKIGVGKPGKAQVAMDGGGSPGHPADPNRFWTIQAYPSGSSARSTQITEWITRETALGITLSGTNLVLSWPAKVGYQLQSTPALGPTPVWEPMTQTPLVQGGNSTVVLPTAVGTAFFRLAKP